MANMEKIYELQARIRKNAMSKTWKEIDIEFGPWSGKPGPYGTVYYRGNKIEFSRIDSLSTKCTVNKIMGFERVELNPTDTDLLEFVFHGGGQCTPAEFKKRCKDKMQSGYRDFSKASPAFDMVVDFWYDQIIGTPAKVWEKAQAAVVAKVPTAPTTQQIIVGNTGKTL